MRKLILLLLVFLIPLHAITLKNQIASQSMGSLISGHSNNLGTLVHMGTTMKVGDYLQNGIYTLVLQGDGNLVLYSGML